MNCQIANDLLIDLLYDELDATTAAKVREHIHHCPSCAAAWEKLSLGAAAASAAMADEPAGSPTFLPPARFAVWRKWALTAAAAAAIFLAVLGLWHLAGGTSAPVIAAPAGPPEMVRKSVSLTILSKPASWDAGYQRGSWPGMALIRDQRIARNLRPGESTIEFANVPANILPDSVRLRSRSNPGGLKILEQNYQFDLASAAAVLDRYIDKTITVTLQDGTAHTGRLLSADPERTPYPYLPDYR
ncbi:MAG: zf-HC2 domain-containing protein, partial [Phycisphaerae bacterium]